MALSQTRSPRPASCLLLLAVLLFACVAGPARAALFDRVQSEVLENGARVIVEEDPTATTVAVQLVVHAGAADEPAKQGGIAHLLEHALWAGRAGDDPRVEVEDAGGTTNAGTLRDFTRFYAVAPAEEWKPALHAVARVVLRPAYDENTLAREQHVVVEEVEGRADQARAMLLDLAFEAVYGSHPYGRRLEGTGESRLGIREADLDSFYRTWYPVNNLALVVTGRVDADTVFTDARHIFADLVPRPVPPRTRPALSRPGPGKEVTIGIAGEDAYVMAAFVGPAFSEPDEVCASDVLTTLLGNPSFGRLKRELVDHRGLARTMGIDFLTQQDRALFGVWAICKPANVAETRRVIREELTRFAAEPVSPHDLLVAKRLTAAGFILANQTPSDRATTLAFYDALGDYREAERYLPRVRAVTAEDVQEVARWYSGDPVWVTLTPKETRQ